MNDALAAKKAWEQWLHRNRQLARGAASATHPDDFQFWNPCADPSLVLRCGKVGIKTKGMFDCSLRGCKAVELMVDSGLDSAGLHVAAERFTAGAHLRLVNSETIVTERVQGSS